MTAAILRGRRRVHRCTDCDFRTAYMLDLWEHRIRTGHMDALR